MMADLVAQLRAEINALTKKNGSLRAANSALRASNDDLREKVSNLEEEVEARSDHPEKAIDSFLNCVERPVGRFKFTIPQTDEVDRCIIALHDAIGRNP